MQQLEPILKYHFWILLGLALIMALTGWWMTTSQMEAAITQKRDAISKADEKSKVGEVPSQDWELKLKAINGQQEQLVNHTRDQLYARQKEKMVWPEVIREFTAKLKYREPFGNTIKQINYRDNYMDEVLRVYKIPRPIVDGQKGFEDGVVQFPFEVMPHREWGEGYPTSTEIWDSMEDLWLLEPILNAVAVVNGGPNATRYDATILAIEELVLRGGDRSLMGKSGDAGGGGGGGGGGAAGGGDMSEMMKAMPGGLGGPSGGFGGPGGGGSAKGAAGDAGATSLEADDDLIFGDAGSAPSTGGGGDAAETKAGGPAFGDMTGNGGGNTGVETGRRYVDGSLDDKTLPYRTRGFKLAVVMDHHKVPELYAQLTSSEGSPWPIQIIQMHVGRLSDGAGPQGDLAMGGMGAMKAGGGMGLAGMAGMAGMAGRAGRGFDKSPFAGRGRKARGDDDGGDMMDMMKGMSGQPGGAMGQPGGGDVFENPYLARVIIWGLITLYTEPEPKEPTAADTPSASTSTPTPSAEPSASPSTADPSATPDSPAATENAIPENTDQPAADEAEMEAEAAGDAEAKPDDAPAETSDEATTPESDSETKPKADEPASDDAQPASDAPQPAESDETDLPGDAPAEAKPKSEN